MFLFSWFHKLLAGNPLFFKGMARGAELGFLAVLLIGLVWFLLPNPPAKGLYELGKWAGYGAIIAYCFTLTPGILTRLKVQTVITAILLSYRRSWGVVMFYLTLIHMCFTIFFPVLAGIRELRWNEPKVWGTLAVAVLIPLYITSNDTSLKILGKKWKTIQRFTYLSLFFIMMHIIFFRGIWMYPTIAFFIAEIVSWGYVFWQKRNTSRVPHESAPLPPSQPEVK